MGISLRNPTGRNTKAHVVTINSNEYFFSYETCIAYCGPSSRHRGIRLANHWGPTTGRHFNELGCGEFPIILDEVFGEIVESSTS